MAPQCIQCRTVLIHRPTCKVGWERRTVVSVDTQHRVSFVLTGRKIWHTLSKFTPGCLFTTKVKFSNRAFLGFLSVHIILQSEYATYLTSRHMWAMLFQRDAMFWTKKTRHITKVSTRTPYFNIRSTASLRTQKMNFMQSATAQKLKRTLCIRCGGVC